MKKKIPTANVAWKIDSCPSSTYRFKWRIVFINTRWRDWSRRTPAPLLTKIRMETNTTRKLTSCMSWKLILLWGFSAIDLPVTKRKKRELIVSVIWRNLLNEERWSRRLELFRRWFLVISCYSCARSVCSCAVFLRICC